MNTTKSVFSILTISLAFAVQGQAQTFLTNGLVAYYPFNGNANDASGNGNNGVVAGAVLTNGMLNQSSHAYYFNGTNASIGIPAFFDAGQPNYTISFWFNTASTSQIDQSFISSCPNGTLQIEYNQAINGAEGYVCYSIGTGSGWIQPTQRHGTNNNYQTNTWYQVALVKQGSQFSLYIDGSLSDSSSATVPDTGPISFEIGDICGGETTTLNPGTGTGDLLGNMDDVRFYNRALSASEVEQLYAYESVPQGQQFSALNLPPITLIAAACDPSNNTYVLGTFTNTVTIGGKLLTSLGGTDYVLAQYHADGTVGWAMSFGSTEDEEAFNTTLNVTSNAVFVSGQTQGSIHLVDTANDVVNTAYNTGDKADGFLLRFSLAGVSQWQASLTSIGNENGAGVSLDNDGNVYWSGCFNGCCPDQGGATLTGGDGTVVGLTTPSYGTAFLAKLSAFGSPLWVATAYNRDVQFLNVTVDSQGNSYVLGWGSSWNSGTPTTVMNGDGSTGAVSNPGTQFGFLAKFNTLGVMQWSATPVGGLDPTYRPICITTGGNVLFGGRYSSGTLTLPSSDGNNIQLAAATGNDGFVAQYNPNGKAIWAVQIPGTNDQSVVSICSVTSNVWVGGLTTGGISLSGVSLTPIGTQNIFIFRMNTNGQVLGGSLIGGTASDALASLQVAGASVGLIAGNEGGNFQGWGSEIANAGPFVLIGQTQELPSITVQPQSVTVNALNNTSFSVTATGTLPMSYQWSLNNTNISGATSNTLTITNASPCDLGSYSVLVTNASGSVTSSNATLSMYPFLAGPFRGLVTDWGYTNVLSVGAWGTGPLSYQWFDNGVAILNATNPTLDFSSIQFTNAGLYSVVVSSPLGSVTNTPAQVVVNPAGVSLGLYAGVTVSGVVGYAYAIQASSDLTDTNGWTTVANLTLMQPVELWVDINANASSPTNHQKYYRVLPGL